MKIVVVGGSGLIGSKAVARLAEHGHEAIAASPDSGVNTVTGQGLAEVLAGAQVVADPEARYFGAHLGERTLPPSADAGTLDPRFEDRLGQTAPQTSTISGRRRPGVVYRRFRLRVHSRATARRLHR
jgi:uncharacterized protein YbjT (DUF2867 family)